jgi:hypothetical protein
VGVDADFRCGQERLTQGGDALGDVAHGHRTARIDDATAVSVKS